MGASNGLPLCIEDDQGRIAWWVERADPYGWLHLKPRQDIDYASPATSIEYNPRWPGHYFDPETGLHYNRYRYYDPRLGRYLQCDPLGHEGSPVNLYAYCPNPLVQVDVLGLDHDGKVASAMSRGIMMGRRGRVRRRSRLRYAAFRMLKSRWRRARRAARRISRRESW